MPLLDASYLIFYLKPSFAVCFVSLFFLQPFWGIHMLALGFSPVLEKAHECPPVEERNRYSPVWKQGALLRSPCKRKRQKEKGGVSGRLVKGNDTPTLVPRELSVSAQPHIPTLHGALYGQVGFLKDRNPCVGLASALLVLTTCLGEKLPHMCSK